MARQVIYDFANVRLKAGEAYGPYAVPPAQLAGRAFAYLTLTVDDPAIDPPTDAKVSGYVEASADGGAGWAVVAYLWGGTSGVLSATVAVAGRAIRAAGR